MNRWDLIEKHRGISPSNTGVAHHFFYDHRKMELDKSRYGMSPFYGGMMGVDQQHFLIKII